jgi:hypothetical protein
MKKEKKIEDYLAFNPGLSVPDAMKRGDRFVLDTDSKGFIRSRRITKKQIERLKAIWAKKIRETMDGFHKSGLENSDLADIMVDILRGIK